MIVALTVCPRPRRVGLYSSLLPNENVVTENLLPFIRSLRRHLVSPIVLVWDRLNVHRSVARELRRRSPSIHPVCFPPYAAELNAVEPFWFYLEMNPLSNHAADHVDELACRAERHSRQIANDEALPRSFLQATSLFFRLR
jgi:transposase